MKDKAFVHNDFNVLNFLLSELTGIGVKIDEEEEANLLLFQS